MKKGYTLFELVVIIALFSIVMAVGFSFLIGSKNNFARSQEKSEMHYQARRASDFIRDEVRNATEFELLETMPGVFSSEYNYLFIEKVAPLDEGWTLIFVEDGVKNPKTMPILDNPTYFILSQELSGNNTLSYTMKSIKVNSLGSRSYSVDTSIHLNNITQALGTAEQNYTNIEGVCIKYKRP